MNELNVKLNENRAVIPTLYNKELLLAIDVTKKIIFLINNLCKGLRSLCIEGFAHLFYIFNKLITINYAIIVTFVCSALNFTIAYF